MAIGTRVRLWQAAAAAIAIAVVAGLGLHILERPGVYFARSYVIVYPPAPKGSDNPLDSRIRAAIEFVGLSARRVGGLDRTAVSVSGQVTLLDQNVPHGTSIRQPSQGGQWNFVFDQPSIEVQATGATPAEVRERVQVLAAEVESEVLASQERLGVGPRNRMRTLRSPPETQVMYAEGSRGRAEVALFGAALLAAMGAAWVTGRVVRMRDRARRGRDQVPA